MNAEVDINLLLGLWEASLNEVYIFDAESLRIDYVNTRARQNLGYELEVLRRMSPLDFEPELTPATFYELTGPLRRREKPKIVLETIHRRANGSEYPVEVHLQLVERGGGAVFLAVINDISERRKTEAALVQLAAIVEFSQDAIFGTDLDSIVTSWNSGAEAIFGYSAAEMVGRPILQIIPDNRHHEEKVVLESLRRGVPTFIAETLRKTRDGRVIDVSVAVSPIRNRKSQTIGTSRIVRDITALKTREREIVRLSRLYAALNQVNQAIVLMGTRDELFQKVCQVLVVDGGFDLAWIGWNDPNTHQLVPVAVSGDEAGYLGSIKVYSDERPDGRVPPGRAFRDNRPCVCDEMIEDPREQQWREEMQRWGFQASVALPIRFSNQVVGVLNVFANEPGFFRDKELSLLAEAASIISFALDNFSRNEERLRTERKLRRERDFSEALLNSLPGVLYLYERSGRFRRWNENFERVSGYSPAEIEVMHPLDFFTGPDRKFVADRIEEVFEQGSSNIEAGFVTKDGRVIPYYFTGVVTRFDGKICLVGVGIDISERKQAESARRDSEALYRTLFEHAPDGILIGDGESNYLDANASMCRMLGYTHEELVGLHAADIISPQEVAQIAPAISSIKAQIGHHQEWQFRRKDGSLFPVEVIATLMPDGNLMGMVRDITERKEAEAALHELNVSLEQKVVERTGELQVALKRAEESDRLKSAFLATMSHELRTPLNSILGFTGTVLQGLAGPVNAEQSKQLGMVRSSARHLMELINDVLDLSKIEAGQLVVRHEPFELTASIARVTAMIAPLAEKKGLVLTTVVAPELGEMVSDRRRVEQIILNLLNNAIKFTVCGSVILTARRVEDSPSAPDAIPQSSLQLSVADTGIGIRPEDLVRIFQPFYQVDNGLARQHEGTGLGLAICRRLVALLGGQISAASEWGIGSEFMVCLPLRRTPES